mgnify:FL=1
MLNPTRSSRVFLYNFFYYFCYMAAKLNTIRLHQDIKKEFDKLSQIEEYGVRKFSIEFILNKVAHEFYKSPKTIENIVFNRTGLSYQNNQTELFSQQ